MTKLTIKKQNSDNENYSKYSSQPGPQPVYLSLNLETGVLCFEVNEEVNSGTTRKDVWLGHTLWVGPVPALKKHSANDFLGREDVQKAALDVLDHVEELHYSGVAWTDDGFGISISTEDHAFFDLVQQELPHWGEQECYRVWSIDAWLEPCNLHDFDLTDKSTKDEIMAAAQKVIDDAEVDLEGDADEIFEYLVDTYELLANDDDDDDDDDDEEAKLIRCAEKNGYQEIIKHIKDEEEER
jgi:hypothetical protein